MVNSRCVSAMLLYNTKNISEDILKYFKSLSYTDAMSGEADDLQLTLEDTEGLWHGDWLPEKGATLSASLLKKYWEYGVDTVELPLGLFEIDEVECKGYPSEVTIKGISIPNKSTLTGVDKTRAWEKAKLETIAKDIAKDAKLELYYDTTDNPVLDRAEQIEQSDLSFLLGLCNNAGLALKVTNNKLVIFDEAKCELVAPTMTIVKPGTVYKAADGMNYYKRVLGYNLKTKVRDIYAACRVEYHNEKKKKNITYTIKAPNKKGKTMVVNEQVDNIQEAEKLAKKKLREKNKEEVTANISIVGEFEFAAGVTVALLGFGKFDGNYIITKASHNVGSGYTMSLDVRKCLDGY